MAFKLGSSFENWLDRKIEVLKAEGILRSKFNDLKRTWSVVSEDEHAQQQTDTRTHASNDNMNKPNMDHFPEYKDNPKSTEQQYTDDPELAQGTLPHDISPNSDYYKFVWQDDEDFEAALGPPGGYDYSDQILREIDSELADLHKHNLGDPRQGQGQRPRSASKRSADKGHVELIQNKNETGDVRFVSGHDDEEEDEEDSFKDVSDGNIDPWKVQDETSNNNDEQFYDTYDDGYDGRGKADGQSTENVHRQGGVDLNGNLSGSGPRELQQAARDASNVRHYYHTQIAPVSKDRILLPMEEVEMSYSEDELNEEQGEAPTDEEAIYSPERQAAEAEDMGIDSDDTRPIVTVDQTTLTQQWKRKTKRLKKAMIIIGVVTAIVAFGLATYFIVHLLDS